MQFVGGRGNLFYLDNAPWSSFAVGPSRPATVVAPQGEPAGNLVKRHNWSGHG